VEPVSVVIPAYEEEDNLAPLLDEVAAALRPLGRAYEVVVVDDGSRDGTPRVLAGLRERHPELRVVRLRRNAGQSAAFLAGFAQARGDVVVTLDADLQNDPADIPRLLAALETSDVVCGVRRRRRDRWLRRLSSRIANSVRRFVLHDGVSDTGCSLKAFRRRQDLLALPRFDGVHRFFPALLRWQGCRVAELEVAHRPRRAGRAKYNVRNRLFRTLVDLFGVRWLKARWTRYEIER
jgi:glycosyltransferase involved in cell wall biosynthesis